MKVSTEACILGATVSATNPMKILDIGTGIGLLALMLAQRFAGDIDAVEVNPDACAQARSNIFNSPWHKRINVFHEDIFTFSALHQDQYDLIVCNPPFYSGSLKSTDPKKNESKHETSQFDQDRFARALSDLLSPDGIAFVLYPKKEADQFAEKIKLIGLQSAVAVIIRNQPSGDIFRSILRISKTSMVANTREFSIRNGNEYTDEYRDLLRPYH